MQDAGDFLAGAFWVVWTARDVDAISDSFAGLDLRHEGIDEALGEGD